MRALLIAALMMAMALAMPAQADGGPDVCDTQAGDAIEDATGQCGGTVEPWQCLGGSGSSRSYSAGGYTVVLNMCRPPPGTLPPGS